MIFRWTPLRDRKLLKLANDLFRPEDCAGILGDGCTADMVVSRLHALDTAKKDIQRDVRYAPQAPLHPVIGLDLAPNGRPVAEGARPSTAAPRPAKIQLPRYGEMEKRFDSITRARLGGE